MSYAMNALRDEACVVHICKGLSCQKIRKNKIMLVVCPRPIIKIYFGFIQHFSCSGQPCSTIVFRIPFFKMNGVLVKALAKP